MKELYYISEKEGTAGAVCLMGTGTEVSKGGNSNRVVSQMIIPGKGISRSIILKFPPVKKKDLERMIKFQIPSYYPGKAEDDAFRYYSFKGKTEWIVVLCFLNINKLEKFSIFRKSTGLLCSIELITKQELKEYSEVVIIFPEVMEIWHIKGGNPVQMESLWLVSPAVENLENIIHIPKFKESGKEKRTGSTLVIAKKEDKERFKTLENLTFRTWKILRRFEHQRNNKGTRKNFLTSILVWAVLTVSALVLIFALLEMVNSHNELRRVRIHAKTLKSKIREQQNKLETIDRIKKKLPFPEKNKRENIYILLGNVCKTLPEDTVLESISLNENILSLQCKSLDALLAAGKAGKTFTHTSISEITTLPDGLEGFTLYLEIKR